MTTHTAVSGDHSVSRLGSRVLLLVSFALIVAFGFILGASRVEAQAWENIPFPPGETTAAPIVPSSSVTVSANGLSAYSELKFTFQYENNGLGDTSLDYYWKPMNGGTSAKFGTLSVPANGKGAAESPRFSVGSTDSIRIWIMHGAGGAGNDYSASGSESRIDISDLKLYGIRKAAVPANDPPVEAVPISAVVEVEDEDGQKAVGVTAEVEGDEGEPQDEEGTYEPAEGSKYAVGIQMEVVDQTGDRPQAITSLQVSAAEIRNLDAERKEEVLAAARNIPEPLTPDQYATWIAGRILNDESIVSVRAEGEKELTITYNTRVHLFGFIPMNVRATGLMTTNNEVKMKLPWYSFLTRKPDVERMWSVTGEIGTAYLRSQEKVVFDPDNI